MLHNLPIFLFLHKDSLPSSVKVPDLQLFFYFLIENIVSDYYMLLYVIFVVTFPFVMENSLFLIIYNLLLFIY